MTWDLEHYTEHTGDLLFLNLCNGSGTGNNKLHIENARQLQVRRNSRQERRSTPKQVITSRTHCISRVGPRTQMWQHAKRRERAKTQKQCTCTYIQHIYKDGANNINHNPQRLLSACADFEHSLFGSTAWFATLYSLPSDSSTMFNQRSHYSHPSLDCCGVGFISAETDLGPQPLCLDPSTD